MLSESHPTEAPGNFLKEALEWNNNSVFKLFLNTSENEELKWRVGLFVDL